MIATAEIENARARTAEDADREVVEILDSMSEMMTTASHKAATLGRLLADVSNRELFRPLGFHSFDSWLKARTEGYTKQKRSQLYIYRKAAVRLLPYVSEETFERMGISKATEIGNGMDISGLPPAPEVIEMALSPASTAREVQAAVYESAHIKCDGQSKGKWFNDGDIIGGFYAEEDVKKDIRRVYKLAMRRSGIGPTVPEHIRRGVFIMALCSAVKVEWENEDAAEYDAVTR